MKDNLRTGSHMNKDEEKPVIQTQLIISGSIKESIMEVFVSVIGTLFNEDPNHFTNKREYGQKIRQYIRHTAIEADTNDKPISFDIYLPNAEISTQFKMYCYTNHLTYIHHISAFTDHHGISHNNSIQYLNENNNFREIMLDCKEREVVSVMAVLDYLERVITTCDKPLKDIPLDINEPGLLGDIARRKMNGEALSKIVMDHMRELILHMIPVPKPFKILKGV